MNSREQVQRRIKRIPRNEPFTPRALAAQYGPSATNKALTELRGRGEVVRLKQGVYVRPIVHEALGPLLPPAEKVAAAQARANGERIELSGPEALRYFGISTQVQMQPTFSTSGRSRSIDVRGTVVRFQHVKEAHLRNAGTPAGRATIALLYLGKEEATPEVVAHIVGKLDPTNRAAFQRQLAHLPVWAQQVVRKATATRVIA